ncbi:N-glycosylase/DNA lyase [Abditibacteriota bacterium]|nr:N-glycosylase/DNA lyase [Abditibacteriota bacterium]
MQRTALYLKNTTVNIEFPNAETEVMPGVQWGFVDNFPSPAYWAFQVLARRIEGGPIRYKLGRTLQEETAACLLGGHGIPAQVGIAAFNHLRDSGVLGKEVPSEEDIFSLLSEPLCINGRNIKYRFARKKSNYLFLALQKLSAGVPPTHSGLALRTWLLSIPGIGYKTASWIARNWLDADDVAILDIHIHRAGMMGGFFCPNSTIATQYIDLEKQFLNLSQGLGVRPSELDAVIWFEMMSSQKTVQRTMQFHSKPEKRKAKRNSLSSSHQSNAYSNQLSIGI